MSTAATARWSSARSGCGPCSARDIRGVRFAIMSWAMALAFASMPASLASKESSRSELDQPCTPGNRGLWIKSKCLNREEFVVVGWTDPGGSRSHFGALLLGYYADDGRLHYAGRAGTGFTDKELRAWRACSSRWRRPACRSLRRRRVRTALARRSNCRACVGCARGGGGSDHLTWTEGGLLRAVSYQGQREAKPARQVIRSKPA